jgi:Methyltransferase domain
MVYSLQRSSEGAGLDRIFHPANRIGRERVLAGMCLINGYRYGAELGVSTGKTTNYLCSLMDDMKMIAVDLWAEQPPRKIQGAETYAVSKGWKHEEHYQGLKEHCARHFPGRVDIRRMDTVQAANTVQDYSLDFVFIDADHTYEGCLADIHAWTPKVKIGGLISGHDYNLKWPGVIRAVEETGGAMIASDSVWMRTAK